MTVKITQVVMAGGEAVLRIAYDNPKGSGNMAAYNLRKQDLDDRLKQIRSLLGRPLTHQDALDAIVAIINEVRQGETKLPEDFDYTKDINQELEETV